jgi:hypothetical protein
MSLRMEMVEVGIVFDLLENIIDYLRRRHSSDLRISIFISRRLVIGIGNCLRSRR